MKFIELFAGTGGLGYGLMQAGMECVGFVECDTKCGNCKSFTRHEVYKKKRFYTVCTVCGTPKKQPTHESFKLLHDPNERMWARYDITTVSDDDIRLLGQQHRIDLISGGFPCQSFSIAGKRKGFADKTRGTLFFEIIRFASILKPKHLLLENVKGLLNHDGGRTYATIICALDELGYDIEWQLLNSKNFGVPQNRERVFIVCHSRTGSRGKVFPITGENSQIDCSLARKLALPGKDQWNRVYHTNGIAPTLTTMQGGRQEPKIIVTGSLEYYGNDQMNRVYDIDGLAPTLTIRKTGNEPKVLVPQQFSSGEGIAYCLTSNYNKGICLGDVGKGKRTQILEAARIRKLTPLECFRLQSYPDHWYTTLKEAGISDSQLYKMAGNGVTSAVAYEIGKRLVTA